MNKEIIECLEGFIFAVEHEGAVSGRVVCAVNNAIELIKKLKQNGNK